MAALDESGGVPGYLGMQFTEVGPGWCTCRVDVTAELLNPFGAAHGAVVASLVDHVLGSAVFPLVPRGTWPASLEFKVNYLAPAREGELRRPGRGGRRSPRARPWCRSSAPAAGASVATALGTVAIVPPKAPVLRPDAPSDPGP